MSLPFDFSCKVPYCPIGAVSFGTPSKSCMFPKPNFAIFGKLSPLLNLQIFANVLHSGISLNSLQSGIAPIPIESITRIIALFIIYPFASTVLNILSPASPIPGTI